MNRPTLTPDESKIPTILRMKDQCLAGYSATAIARFLNAEKIPSPRGKLWSDVSVNNVLSCAAHAGLVVGEGGDFVPGRHYHRRLWDPEERNRILDALASRKRRFEYVQERHADAFLLGVVKCGQCGRFLRWSTDAASNYRCLGERNASEGSAHVYVNAKNLWTAVRGHIEGLASRPEVVEEAKRNIASLVNAELTPIQDELAAIQRRIEGLADKKRRWFDAFESGDIERGHVAERIRQIELDLSTALTQASELEARLAASGERERQCERALEALSDFAALWDRLRGAEQRELLRTCIESVEVLADEGRIFARLKLVASAEVEISILRGRKRWAAARIKGPEGLTPRKHAVLYHILEERTTVQIAALMGTSVTAVGKHLKECRQRLKATTNMEAARACEAFIRANLSALPLYSDSGGGRKKKGLRVMERQVLERRARGETVEGIAYQFQVPEFVIEQKLTSALNKVGTSDPTTAWRLANERGLLPTEYWETGTRTTAEGKV